MSGLVTCFGVELLEAQIVLPINGRWWAKLISNTPTVPLDGAQATIAAEGGLSLTGTVQHAGVRLEAIHAHVVGGAGGLDKPVVGAWRSATARDPLQALASATGEKLSSTIAAAILSTPIAYLTLAGTGGVGLDAICRAIGPECHWRFLGDGTMWVGNETWPAARLDDDSPIVDTAPAEHRFIIAPATPSLLPGYALGGVGNIVEVIHWVEPNQVRTWVTTETSLSDTMRDLVRRALSLLPGAFPSVDRLALYRATVQACASDGSTVDISPEARHLGPMQGVPVRVGLPGATATMQSGAIVLVGWEAGDPMRPYAVPAWEAGASVVKLVLRATTIYLGDDSGADALVKKTEFGSHTHAAGTLMAPEHAGLVTGSTASASAITGTTQVQAK